MLFLVLRWVLTSLKVVYAPDVVVCEKETCLFGFVTLGRQYSLLFILYFQQNAQHQQACLLTSLLLVSIHEVNNQATGIAYSSIHHNALLRFCLLLYFPPNGLDGPSLLSCVCCFIIISCLSYFEINHIAPQPCDYLSMLKLIRDHGENTALMSTAVEACMVHAAWFTSLRRKTPARARELGVGRTCVLTSVSLHCALIITLDH